ncbi:HNH endonuclease [Vampirovibrio sp.]|uniref:HNH endonuclease n=1 Tax=Vampirovibrio sp. TaxID=2717857 RepID=UPI00359420B5
MPNPAKGRSSSAEEDPKRPSIPSNTCKRLWLAAGGRCEYENCNEELWRNNLTFRQMNKAYIAHIVSWKPSGPRGEAVDSDRLKIDISNLMLMCDQCHRVIDDLDVPGHPRERLEEMKRKHEVRIQLLTGIKPNMSTEILIYGSNIGSSRGLVRYDAACQAILPERIPASPDGLVLGMQNSTWEDRSEQFWMVESTHLMKMFNDRVRPRLRQDSISHISVFAVAPIPLLILLGSLLTHLPPVDIRQLQREPVQDWKWQPRPAEFGGYILTPPATISGPPALIMSLSGTITLDRIQAILGDNFNPWVFSIKVPSTNFLKSPEQLSEFRLAMRECLDQIKVMHGSAAIHLFPAIPNSIAVEMGRILLEKADPPLRVYDEGQQLGGFIYALDINQRALPVGELVNHEQCRPEGSVISS